MEMYQVTSRAISAIGYDSNTLVMKITFKQGKTYDFCRVPQQVFEQFLAAPSQGKFYDKQVKDKYQCF